MKWLEELKASVAEGGYDLAGLDVVDINREYIDRLIEIAERAEWAGISRVESTYYNTCPICEGFLIEGKHASDCPYSDEWEPT